MSQKIGMLRPRERRNDERIYVRFDYGRIRRDPSRLRDREQTKSKEGGTGWQQGPAGWN